MIRKEVTIQNKTGLHARPASLLVKEAAKYSSVIKIIKDDKEYNAKSIMGILSMAAGKGDIVVIQAEGTDEEASLKGLSEFISTLED